MSEQKITNEMIDTPFADAVLVNYRDACAMKMEVEEDLFVYFAIELDETPEEVDYSVDNIIKIDDQRG